MDSRIGSPSPPSSFPAGSLVVEGVGFAGWQALNDTVMGGRSSGHCSVDPEGLGFDGVIVEEGGGFISMRSPLFSPPLDLSSARGLELSLRGEGRRFKLAVACADGVGGLTEMIPGGLRWVKEFSTEVEGVSRVALPFAELIPSLRAQPLDRLPLGLPLRLDISRITRLQVLHSRFSDDGGPNPGFRAGPIHLRLHGIHALA
ncbi:MAG: CIA30 family protein [Cyanobacteria bacterium K_Offshore_surface_m2_239]|nr:CIA30 family protein [Cyanobacteria bacterium K_Offshore_surface_m2_239]